MHYVPGVSSAAALKAACRCLNFVWIHFSFWMLDTTRMRRRIDACIVDDNHNKREWDGNSVQRQNMKPHTAHCVSVDTRFLFLLCLPGPSAHPCHRLCASGQSAGGGNAS